MRKFFAICVLAVVSVFAASACFALSVKDTITMGEYETKPIEWVVLDVQDGKALLFAKDPVLTRSYHGSMYESAVAVAWKDSDLHKWLNDNFMRCFTDEEAAKILTDENTGDKVTLLTVDEVNKYLAGSDLLIAKMPTPWDETELEAKSWWLRPTSDEASDSAPYVGSWGEADESGYFVNSNGPGVRPVIWINAE